MPDRRKELLGLFQDLCGAVAKLKTICPPDSRDHLDAIISYTVDCLNWAKRNESHFAPTSNDDVYTIFGERISIGADLTAQEGEAVRLVCNAIALACHVVVTMLGRPAGDPQTEAPPPPPTPLGGPALASRRGFHLIMEQGNVAIVSPPTGGDVTAWPSIRGEAMQRFGIAGLPAGDEVPGWSSIRNKAMVRFAFAGRPAGGGTTEGPGPVEEAATRPAGDPQTEGPDPWLKKW